MSIEHLHVHSLRAFHKAKFTFHPKFNYIFGGNGSGKTTILEAIYLLGSGHSFKTREISPLVQHGQTRLVIYGKSIENTFSIAKSVDSPTIVKINGQTCMSASQLAYLLPCQVYYQDIFQIMDSGPGVRRSMIDWGMFHVKHNYLELWKRYKQILKQRNSLLKKRPSSEVLAPWDNQLASVGEQIANMRGIYIEKLALAYQQVLEKLSAVKINLTYNKGWDKKGSGISLKESLSTNHEKDIHRGFTSVGIHQAEILVESDESQAKKILSRGQQKIALIALKLSQCQLLTKRCIHLMDDIFAELDAKHQEKLAEYIRQSDDQYFITILENDKSKVAPFPEGNHITLAEETADLLR